MRGIVFTTATIGYLFYTDANSDFAYKKTTDGGLTWGAAVLVSAAETIVGYDVWYDQWTPGNTGRIIHIWYFGTADDDIIYKALNTTNDALTSAVIVFNGATAVAGRGTFVSGAKMRGGNLLCCFDIDAGAETGTYRSVDNGATWASRTNLIEATLDQALVFPANVADPNDGWFLYYDASALAVTLKEHDDSANTNAESATIVAATAGITDLTGQYNWCGSVRHSDGHLIAGIWTERDSVTGDFRLFDIASTASFPELTALATNIDDSYYPSMFIDQRRGDIYVAYVGKLDGTETLDTTASVYYAKSADRGVTWTTNVLISATGSDWRGCWTPLSGSRFMAVWQDISSLALFTNNDNSQEFGYLNLNNYEHIRVYGSGGFVAEKTR
jgi:hypothetical protein